MIEEEKKESESEDLSINVGDDIDQGEAIG